MSKSLVRWIAALLIVPGAVHATIREHYPLLDMAFVGNHVVEDPAGTTLSRPFALRITDSAGNPLAGLTVVFEPDYLMGIPGTPLPPLSAYGNFAGAALVSVITDQNGIARSPDFRIGQIPHNVLAHLFAQTPEDLAVTQGGFGYALFHVNSPHYGPTDPQAPIGGTGPAQLPANSPCGLALLFCGLLFAAFGVLRRTSGRECR